MPLFPKSLLVATSLFKPPPSVRRLSLIAPDSGFIGAQGTSIFGYWIRYTQPTVCWHWICSRCSQYRRPLHGHDFAMFIVQNKDHYEQERSIWEMRLCQKCARPTKNSHLWHGAANQPSTVLHGQPGALLFSRGSWRPLHRLVSELKIAPAEQWREQTQMLPMPPLLHATRRCS